MEAKLEKIDSSFIGRQIVSPTMLNFMKGTIWGSAWAGSQTISGAWLAARKAAGVGKALDPELFKSLAATRAKTLFPVVIAHTAAFAMIRGNDGSTLGLKGMVLPMAMIAAPTIGYAAFYRAAPPAALLHGVVASGLLHIYDRVLTTRFETLENMPTTKLHRRSF